jgi:hypothetical protein
MVNKVQQAVVDALKLALSTHPDDHRLYRAGKLAGLFAGKGGTAGDAAAQALRDGLLERSRTESKGKTEIEWVRLTPAGIDFLHAHESPRAVLGDLRAALAGAQVGVPAWLERIQGELSSFSTRIADELAGYRHQLAALTQRVDDALRRLDLAEVDVPASVPWGAAALTYLDRRRTSGATAPCPLPELFTAVHRQHPDLGLVDFQDGVRRLHDTRALELLPVGTADFDPIYAVPASAGLLYFAQR